MADLAAGASLAKDNLWVAASDGDLDRVRELLESGMSVDAKDESGYTPLHAAVSYNHLHLVEFLLQRGADVNVCDADNDTPLHVCETVECFELLLRNGANLRAQNDEGYTPLDSAIENEHEEVASRLMELGLTATVALASHEEQGDEEAEATG